MLRTTLLLLVMALTGSILPHSAAAQDDQTLARAAEYLWSKQAADGPWRSEQYAVLRSGEALTPFVLHALLGSIDSLSSDDAGKVRRAAQFIIEHIDDEGAVGRDDPDILGYPVYSTAYAVKSFRKICSYEKAWRPASTQKMRHSIRQMQAFLLSAQYQEANGFSKTDVPYGGWGFNAPVRSGMAGHMDLAHTRKALAALHFLKDSPEVLASRQRAQQFLLLMQKHSEATAPQPHPMDFLDQDPLVPFDGGFYFSPVALSANKALYDEKNFCWRSYATATCDGILALLDAGVGKDDKRVVAAVAWLKQHDDVDYPQGVPTDHPEPWGEAIRFYHYSVRAEVYDRLGFSLGQRKRLAAAVLKHQRPDGRFASSCALMKEDDPLLCTALAVIALTHCQP